MLRRNARLRREYLYKKSVEVKERTTADRKRKYKEAVDAGKPVPTELRRDADALQREIDTNERLVADAQATRQGISTVEEYDHLQRECPICFVTTLCNAMLTRSTAACDKKVIRHGGQDYPVCECGPAHLVCSPCAQSWAAWSSNGPIRCTSCQRFGEMYVRLTD